MLSQGLEMSECDKEKPMNLQRLKGKSKILTGAMILLLGMAGWGVARASQKFFSPGVHISMKMADPAEGPSRTGFAPVVKAVLPDVVNIPRPRSSKHPTRISLTCRMECPHFSNSSSDNNLAPILKIACPGSATIAKTALGQESS